ncbi:hypothetical protein [Sporosarcina saromensis]|uniref:hypothetical protein n=1 Tax=Sporosarcina saromensis TaxID=359365 RepID=UPI00295E90E2|nr:hypothetical protein [Sporosarcina saromensis]
MLSPILGWLSPIRRSLSPILSTLSPIRRGLSPIRATLSPSRQVHSANEMNLQWTIDNTIERAASLNYSIELSRRSMLLVGRECDLSPLIG